MRSLARLVAVGALVLPACGGKTPAGDETATSGTETSGDGDSDSETGQESGSSETGDGDGDGDGDGECLDAGAWCDQWSLECCGLCNWHTCEGPGCDPGTQDCSEGKKCTAYVMTPGYCCVDADKCVEIIGDRQLGDLCQRMPENDDCDKGLFCMTKTSGDSGEGVCLAFCDINNPASCTDTGLPNGICVDGFEALAQEGILPLCLEACDPLAQDCTVPQGCYAAGAADFVCNLPGYDDGKGNDDDDCYTIQSCKPGLLCANGMGQEGCQSDACCTPFCTCDPNLPSGDGDVGDQCDGNGEECLCYFTEMAPPEYETVGSCALP
jgi:hypothetical protein